MGPASPSTGDRLHAGGYRLPAALGCVGIPQMATRLGYPEVPAGTLGTGRHEVGSSRRVRKRRTHNSMDPGLLPPKGLRRRLYGVDEPSLLTRSDVSVRPGGQIGTHLA